MNEETPHRTPSSESHCQRALFGWSPARLPADTRAKRRLDRLFPATGRAAALYFGAVIGLLIVAGNLPQRPALVADGFAAASGGLWCGGNFWRCRHAHCLITGTGWSLLSLFTFAEAALGHSLIGGNEQRVLLGILLAGLIFEGYWQLRYGTNAVTRHRPAEAGVASPSGRGGPDRAG